MAGSLQFTVNIMQMPDHFVVREVVFPDGSD
jgi:hypothetical protein